MNQNEDKYLFNSNLKKLLKNKGISSKELAKMTNISCPTISAYINNKIVPKLEPTIRICDALNVSIDYMLEREHYFVSENKSKSADYNTFLKIYSSLNNSGKKSLMNIISGFEFINDYKKNKDNK